MVIPWTSAAVAGVGLGAGRILSGTSGMVWESMGEGVLSIVSPPSSRPAYNVPRRILLNYTVNHQYNNTPFVHRSRRHCGHIVIPYNTKRTERFIKQWMSFFVSGLTRSIINNADILSATASAANQPISRSPRPLRTFRNNIIIDILYKI